MNQRILTYFKKFWLLMALGFIAILAVSSFVLSKYGYAEPLFIKSGITLVTTLTLLGLIWYADETRKMKSQMTLQNIYQNSPYVTAEWTGGTGIHVKNLGPGMAMSIQIEIVSASEAPDGSQFFLPEKTIDHLSTDGEHVIWFTYRKDQGDSQAHEMRELTSEVKLEIYYLDRVKRRYCTQITLKNYLGRWMNQVTNWDFDLR